MDWTPFLLTLNLLLSERIIMNIGQDMVDNILSSKDVKSGVYLITDKNLSPIYAGYSKSGGLRVLSHLCCAKYGDDKYEDAEFIFFKNINLSKEDLMVIEMAIISEAKPSKNIINYDFFKWYSSLPSEPRISKYEASKYASQFMLDMFMDELFCVNIITGEVGSHGKA